MVREICIVENFIVPSLVDKTFGHLLEWVDEDKKIFKVFWSHKSCKTWLRKYFAVFLEWDRVKGRINHSDDPEFFTKSKGRFRSALNRLSLCGKVIKLRSNIVGYKMYQLNLSQDAMPSPVYVPEVYVEVPCGITENSPSISLHDTDDNEDENCKTNANDQHELQISENPINYYEDLPDEISYSLDAINGDLVMTYEIQEELNIPDTINLSENIDAQIYTDFTESIETQISDDFLNIFQN